MFVMICYLAYNAVNGDLGLLPMRDAKRDIVQLHQELDEIRSERLNLENHTRLLRSESLDIDLLDELARSMLGVAHPEDKIIMTQ